MAHPLVDLARKAIEAYLKYGKIIKPSKEDLKEPIMRERKGVFVSLKKHGELRGCIGTFLPTANSVAEEVIRNAIASATEDPRFPPVTLEELKDITISVDVLDEPEPVSSLDELDPKKYGVIVESGWKRGLLLPDLEGVDTIEQQIAIAMAKAGIRPGEPIKIYRFKVKRFK
ncbi:MAG: AmmeMemoRadiSam system protein A [Thermosulfidibacteraceae bacterium]|jgi:AmmeMemoRadiSam system protein A